MAWRDEWTQLHARLEAFDAMARAYARCRQWVSTTQTLPLSTTVKREAEQLRDHLRRFVDANGAGLPAGVEQAVKRFADSFPTTGDELAVAALSIAMIALRAEIEFVLTDTEVLLTRSAERAFAHLQRQIVADPTVGKTWQTAFAKGETACEALGATHLLLHGLWAFKANSSGGRTDLVLGENLLIDETVRAAASGLVLTEWKLVRDTDDWTAKRDEAKKQTLLYNAGVLAGFELRQTRYLVLVSRPGHQATPAFREGDFNYRVIHIAVDPATPSRAARAQAVVE